MGFRALRRRGHSSAPNLLRLGLGICAFAPQPVGRGLQTGGLTSLWISGGQRALHTAETLGL